MISIHAPLAGCDAAGCARGGAETISIHAPLAGCDGICRWDRVKGVPFQSTHPLRGATCVTGGSPCQDLFQSTHPLRGATAGKADDAVVRHHFNPRTPCGVRQGCPCSTPALQRFQSTHPLRGATSRAAPRSGRPRSFQSTHPLRGATPTRLRLRQRSSFQSTHPLRGATSMSFKNASRSMRYFNPRTPCGVRRRIAGMTQERWAISIHAPLAGCDLRLTADGHAGFAISIHAPLAGCDDVIDAATGEVVCISIHAPLAGCDDH